MSNTNYPPSPVTARTEAAHVRSQLKLRWNAEQGCYEVYSTIHGSGVFRWFKIPESTKNWYVHNFKLEVEHYANIDGNTGAFKNYQPTSGA